MSDGLLTLKSQDVLDSIDRDITEFNTRGFTPTKRTAFDDAISAFDAMPGDNYLLGQQQVATGLKNDVRAACETKANIVFTAVQNFYGADSDEYHLFAENKPMSKLTDLEFLGFFRDFAQSTEDHLTDLADQDIDATFD